MAKTKLSIETAANSTGAFTAQQVADFRSGALQLKGLELIQMRKAEKAEAELEALKLIEGIIADPSLRAEVSNQTWAQDYTDDAGDIVSPFDEVDFNNLEGIDGFFSGALRFCTNARSGKLDTRTMGTVVSFTEVIAAGRTGTKKNISVSGVLDNGKQFTARLNDERTKTMGSSLRIGSKVELSGDADSGFWVDSVLTESAEVVKQREELAAKAKAAKIEDIDLQNKSSKGAAIVGIANSGNITDPAALEALLKAIQSM